jgi:MoxR-like ATPase
VSAVLPQPERDARAGATAERERLIESAARLRAEVARRIVGQEAVLDEVLMAILAGGHALLVGVPGLAKTLVIRSIAEAMRLDFRRIQFTPDLVPSDITGTEILEEDSVAGGTGKRSFRFVRGPIFANVVLADEINRTPPRTQAALLEAMQEHRVTAAGVSMPLPEPFFVLATQNPIEQEGTYPLPEAQLDRFMFNVVIEYPTEEEERRILAQTTGNSDPPIAVVATGEEIERMHSIVRDVPAAENVIDYATRLVRATRPLAGESTVPDFVRKWVRWGAGPRAGQALLLGAKARALLEGHSVVDFADISAVALPVLRHRVLVNFQAEADGIDADEIVRQLLTHVRARG